MGGLISLNTPGCLAPAASWDRRAPALHLLSLRTLTAEQELGGSKATAEHATCGQALTPGALTQEPSKFFWNSF